MMLKRYVQQTPFVKNVASLCNSTHRYLHMTSTTACDDDLNVFAEARASPGIRGFTCEATERPVLFACDAKTGYQLFTNLISSFDITWSYLCKRLAATTRITGAAAAVWRFERPCQWLKRADDREKAG